MLPAWAAVALGLGGAAIAAAATLGAVWLQARIGSQQSRRRERKEHEREGRAVVVELVMMVRESDHVRYMLNTNHKMLEELVERRKGLRDLEKRLLLWAAEDDDSSMTQEAREFIAAVDRTLYTSALVVSEAAAQKLPTQAFVERAHKDHAEATELGESFLAKFGEKAG